MLGASLAFPSRQALMRSAQPHTGARLPDGAGPLSPSAPPASPPAVPHGQASVLAPLGSPAACHRLVEVSRAGRAAFPQRLRWCKSRVGGSGSAGRPGSLSLPQLSRKLEEAFK